ncbi:glucose-6-phosphate dehydrogenase [Teredinibacter waterburyi]|uniref:glucose-6-phosphate dehydrogenase n=1 Tax=Teredinibacter waterburyi TaxID=1500538 RepID=UPI00165F37C9|nr:glucose-6-phosphate dehydrogenase [Teredinibacter waterburyi]
MNTDLLIVGGDGDLALRKLYPSLYFLELNNCMPDDVRIIGMARTGQTREEFHQKIHTWLKKSIRDDLFSEEKWQRFADKIWFGRGDATNPDELAAVKQEFFTEDHQLVIYLAIPPKIFGTVCNSLNVCGLNHANARLVVEKPLGDSRESFLEINNELSRTFTEQQLFRIDHYLGKESVQNLLALRFANDIFEPLWNSKYIDHIQITVTESVGVGNRWAFYDQTGATRDMVQNHLLQVLCLVAMEPPACLNADSVRAEKLKVLNALRLIPHDEVETLTVRGQYSSGNADGEIVPGYLEEKSDKYEIDPNSKTETFVAIKAEIENWRWSGVPIYLRTGKRLNKRHSEIVIQFKQNRHQIFSVNHSEHKANQLIIQLQPDEGISIRVMNKVPGLDAGIPLKDDVLNLSFAEQAKKVTHDAYSRLFFDVLRNDQTLFVSAAEVEAAWTWVDQIFAGWDAKNVVPEEYAAGSLGPRSADLLMENDGRRWLNEGFELWCSLT